ncbi:MAG TPA: histidinol-phosphatase HisJ family protein [Thermoanaerobaculaceae bacterium]|nr:histidinol-phosphatase HisJ family protein [Thermoanaerobaculaceae bacterium]
MTGPESAPDRSLHRPATHDPRSTAFPCDTHTHTARCGHATGRDDEFVEAAVACGLGAIAVTDHLPFYWLPREEHDLSLAMPPEELPRYVDAVLELKERNRGRIEVLLGIEADFVEGFEGELADQLARYPFDVVLGSEHWLDGWCVDDASSIPRYQQGRAEVDRIWTRYAQAVVAAARSGLFDVLAHLDLPKKFGFRPSEAFAGREADVVEAVAASGCAVELSSGGLRKPVGEEYPGPGLLRRLVAAGAPLVLSSDAHAPAEVGFGFGDLVASAVAAGARETLVFRGRRRTPVPL